MLPFAVPWQLLPVQLVVAKMPPEFALAAAGHAPTRRTTSRGTALLGGRRTPPCHQLRRRVASPRPGFRARGVDRTIDGPLDPAADDLYLFVVDAQNQRSAGFPLR